MPCDTVLVLMKDKLLFLMQHFSSDALFKLSGILMFQAFGFDVNKYENVSRWLNKIKTSAPGYRKANSEGVEIMRKFFQEKLAEIEASTENEPSTENESSND